MKGCSARKDGVCAICYEKTLFQRTQPLFCSLGSAEVTLIVEGRGPCRLALLGCLYLWQNGQIRTMLGEPLPILIGQGSESGLVAFAPSRLSQLNGMQGYAMRSVPKKQRAGRYAMKFFARSLLFGFSVLGWGCSGDEILQPTAADQQAILEAAAAPHRLQPGEKIRITVYGEQGLSGDYAIDPSGAVSLPLAGTVEAAGLTQSELERRLTERLSSEYLRNPKVTVSIVEFRPFYILGEVEKPGAYPYTGGLNVLSAIAIAGGTTYRANRSKIYIQHVGENGLREYVASAAIPILPGDVIQIPRRYF